MDPVVGIEFTLNSGVDREVELRPLFMTKNGVNTFPVLKYASRINNVVTCWKIKNYTSSQEGEYNVSSYSILFKTFI